MSWENYLARIKRITISFLPSSIQSLEFVIDRLVRTVNGLNDWKDLKSFQANFETFVS